MAIDHQLLHAARVGDAHRAASATDLHVIADTRHDTRERIGALPVGRVVPRDAVARAGPLDEVGRAADIDAEIAGAGDDTERVPERRHHPHRSAGGTAIVDERETVADAGREARCFAHHERAADGEIATDVEHVVAAGRGAFEFEDEEARCVQRDIAGDVERARGTDGCRGWLGIGHHAGDR